MNFFRPVKPTMTNGPLIGEFAVPNKIANIFKHRSGSPLFRSGGPLTGCSNMFCNDGKSLKNLHFATLPKCTHIIVHCLKIIEKVAFNIVSKARYVHILVDIFDLKSQKWPILQVFEKSETFRVIFKHCVFRAFLLSQQQQCKHRKICVVSNQ